MRAALSLALLLTCSTALADETRTEAPYFLVKSDSPGVDRLPLQETRADVDIAGVIAKVTVTQIYKNEGSRPIEAIYVFPGGTRAAVFGMRMTIGERKIVAEIKEKEQARRLYEQAKAQGKSASLLEQHRPNVFQMNVANIMPGDRIKVELRYTELLVPENGTYAFVYPTVVGPRFSENAQGSDAGWTKNPYTQGSKPSYTWDLSANINAGMPIEAVSSSTHRVSPRFSGPNRVGIEVDDASGGNRDFVLSYRLSGRQIQTGMLTFEGEEENFFLMMMQPPQRPAANAIPPREYIFIVDVSGSMRGFPLDVTKSLMKRLMPTMKPQDRFNVMLFAGGNRVLSDRSLPATPANLDRAMDVLERQRGGGGTRILPAIQKALAMPRDEEMSTTIVVLTDGYVSVERAVFDTIRQNLNRANLFAFGIGKSVNRHLIEGMARSGMGEPFVVMKPNQGAEVAARFADYVGSPVLTDVGVRFDGFNAYDVEPSTLPDLFAQRPVIMFGKYRGKAEGRIVVEGKNGAGAFSHAIAASDATPSEDNVALRYLWARHRIASLADVGRLRRHRTSVKKEVTELGLKYSLMTEYTSFVAIDSLVRNHSGSSTRVDQPLPTPEGVAAAQRYARPAPKRRRPPSIRRGQYRAPPPMVNEPVAEAEAAPMTKSLPGLASGGGTAGRDFGDSARLSGKRSEEKQAAVRMKFGGVSSRVRKALMRQQNRLARCMKPGQTIRLRIEADERGRIKSVNVLGSSGSAQVDRCVVALLQRLSLFDAGRAVLTIQRR